MTPLRGYPLKPFAAYNLLTPSEFIRWTGIHAIPNRLYGLWTCALIFSRRRDWQTHLAVLEVGCGTGAILRQLITICHASRPGLESCGACTNVGSMFPRLRWCTGMLCHSPTLTKRSKLSTVIFYCYGLHDPVQALVRDEACDPTGRARYRVCRTRLFAPN